MAEYIKREEVIKMAKINKAVCQCLADIVDVRDIVNCVPTADVAPVRHGHWIICSDGYYPYCSECTKEPQGRVMTDWCPNCGAKMDGEDGESNE